MGSETNRSETMAIGNVATRGRAWWASEFERLHFDGSIPLDVARELIGWTVVKVPVQYVNPATGETVEYPGQYVNARSDTGQPIGTAGKVFTPVVPWDWFINGPAAILNTFPDELNLGYVGLMKNSSVAVVQIELAETVSNKMGVDFRPFIWAGVAFDGSMKASYGAAYTRIVCENTFSMAAGESKGSGLLYAMRQTTNARLDVDAVRDSLGLVYAVADRVNAETQRLCETTVSDRQWSAFVEAHAPIVRDGVELSGRSLTMAENKRDALTQLWNADPRVSPWRGTAFGVSQAVTTYGQHMSIVRNVSRTERQKLDMVTGATTEEETEALRTLELILAAG